MADILELDERTTLSVVVLLRNWWNERNNRREGEKAKSPVDLAYIIQWQINEFEKLNERDRAVTNTRPSRNMNWIKPPLDRLKINTDGAFSPLDRTGSWGYAIRDSVGEVICAGTGKIEQALDALHAEAVACMEGLSAAADHGMQNLILESDSLMLINALQGDAFRMAATGGIIAEIKHLIASSFVSFVSNHCPRDCNRLAHAIAKLSCMCPQDSNLLWDGTPPGVEDLVASDSAAPSV